MKLLKKTMIAAAIVGTGLIPSMLHAQAPSSAEIKTAYREVNSKLDRKDCISYYYSNMKPLVSTVEKLSNEVFKIEQISQIREAEMLRAFIVSRLQASGIPAVEALGLSAVKNESNYTIKSMSYAPAGKQKGLIWNFYGKKAHAFENAALLPKDTLLMLDLDLNGKEIFKFVNDTIVDIDKELQISEPLQGFREGLENAAQMGVDVKAFAGSVESITIAVGNTPGKEMSPGKTPGLSGVTVILGTSDSRIYDQIVKTLKQQNPNVLREDGTVVLPIPVENGVFLTVSAWQAGKKLIISTEGELIQATAKGASPNLSANQEFIGLSKNMPQNANQRFFLSGKLANTADSFITLYAPQPLPLDFKELFKLLRLDRGTYAIAQQIPSGQFSICNTGIDLIALMSNPRISQAINSVSTIPLAVILPALQVARMKARIPMNDNGGMLDIEDAGDEEEPTIFEDSDF